MREDVRIRITPVLREGSFLRSEIPSRRRDVLNSVFGEEKAGKRRWPVSKEKIGGRGHRYKRGNGKKRQEREIRRTTECAHRKLLYKNSLCQIVNDKML